MYTTKKQLHAFMAQNGAKGMSITRTYVPNEDIDAADSVVYRIEVRTESGKHTFLVPDAE